MSYDLAFIGAGNMAEAIARGVIEARVFSSASLIASDPSPQRQTLFSDELHVETVTTAREAAKSAKALLLCVKPQVMNDVLAELKTVVSDQTLIISIAAGIRIAQIEGGLAPAQPAVIRTMPNTPLMVGMGAVALSAGSYASSEHMARAKAIFSPAAKLVEVDEKLLDAVTALSGSGPAYVFFLAEQMIRAGIEMGLTPDDAKRLALQTIAGSAKMLSESTDSPQELRRKVTSPNGTTHAAITYMQSHGWDQITVDALMAAELRGKELGGG